MMKKSKNPRIRFKGFTDDWEQRKLDDLFVFLKNNTLSRAQLNLNNGLAINIHYGDILIAYNEYTDLSKEKKQYITNPRIVQQFSSSYLKNGDIVLADTAEDETVGKCTELHGIHDEIVISGLHTIPLRNKEKFASGYLGYYMNSNIYHDQLKPLMQGVKVTSISRGAIKDTYIKFPKTFDEKEKIGLLLNLMNRDITLHQRKLEKLELMKKSLLQKMFPKSGNVNPKIRFKGYTDDWEQRKVGEICSISTGKSNTQDKVDSGKYPLYVRSPIIEHSEKYLYDEEAVLTVGDGVGTGKVFHYVNGKYDLHQRVYRMYNFSDCVDARFFYEWFSKNFYKRVMSMTAKTSVDSVRYDMISEMDMRFPLMSEQIKIADFLFLLEQVITLHQRKLEKLKLLKKTLLQDMFPSE